MARAWTPTLVTIIPTVPGFQRVDKLRVNLGSNTWKDVLLACGISLDTTKYCLKSATFNKILSLDDKVSSYVNTFKNRLRVYKVKITGVTRGNRRKIGDKCGIIIKSSFSLEPEPLTLELPIACNNDDHSAAKNVDAETSRVFPDIQKFLNTHCKIFPPAAVHKMVMNNDRPEKGGRFEEDEMCVESPQYDVERPNCHFEEVFMEQDFDDSASQCSQDTQMDLYDIQTEILQRLRRTPNSVWHKVRQEIQELKQRRNYLKISGYIPSTVNLLNHLFQE